MALDELSYTSPDEACSIATETLDKWEGGSGEVSYIVGRYELINFPKLYHAEQQNIYGRKCQTVPTGGGSIIDTAYSDAGWITGHPLVVVGVCANGDIATPLASGELCSVQTPKEPPDCECEEGDTPISGPPQITVGNPIAIDSGAKLERQQDYVAGNGTMRVDRRYRSRVRNGNFTQSLLEIAGFGESWHGLLPGRLTVYGTDMGYAEYLSPSGATKRFLYDASNPLNFLGSDETRLRLSTVASTASDRTAFYQDVVSPPNPAGEVRLDFSNGDYILFRRSSSYDAVRNERYLYPVEEGAASGYRRWFDYGDDDEYPSGVHDNLGRSLTIQWVELGWASTQLRGLYLAPGQATTPSGMKQRKAIGSILLPDGTSLAYSYGQSDQGGYLGNLTAVRHLSADGGVLWARSYLYEDSRFPSALTGMLDQNGARLSTYAYDAAGRAILSEHAGGVDHQDVTYSDMQTDGSNDVRVVTNPLGLQTQYVYTGYNEFRSELDLGAVDSRVTPRRLISMSTLPAANISPISTNLAYDQKGLLASVMDPNGNASSQMNDGEKQRPTSYVDPNGVTTEVQWHDTLDLPVREVKPGLTTEYTYDSSGRLLTRTETDTSTQSIPYSTAGQTRTTTFSWNDTGQLLSINGPLPPNSAGQDDITSFTYDSSGNRQSMIDGLGHIVQFGNYDANGNPGQITDPNGVVTVFGYDGMGRIKSVNVKHPTDSNLDAITLLDYNSEGRVIGLTRPGNVKLNFDYDLAGRLITARTDDGERIDYVYDRKNDVLSETIKRADGTQSRAVNRTFDELGRLLTETLGPGRTRQWAYDPNGNPIAVTTPRGNVTTQSFDALDRLVSSAAPAAGTTSASYDAQDNLTSFTDAISVTTTIVRDGFGEVIQEISPDRGTSTYRYDAAGDLVSAIDGRGQEVVFTRDILGRVTTKLPVGRPAEKVTYDWDQPDTDATWRIGRLTRIRDASGVTVFNYDHRGNLTAQRQKLLDTPDWFTLRYSYDVGDRVTQITYPSGRQVKYVRDVKGRVTAIKTRASSADAAWTPLASGMAYEPFGSLKTITLSNGLKAVNNWGDDGRLASRRLFRTNDGSDLSKLTYGYDADDNITRITDVVNSGATRTYGYDAAGRLIRTDVASAAFRRTNFSYDDNGNRLKEARRVLPTDSQAAEVDRYSYTPGTNQLQSIRTSLGVRSIGYDARGNTVSESRPGGVSADVGYDGYGRLVSYARSDVTTLSFSYNGRDDRVAMQTASGTRRFVYSPDGRVMGEYGASATDIKAEFVWTSPLVGEYGPFGGDDGIGGYAPLVVATPDNGGAVQIEWVHGSHLGVPVITTDLTGAIVATPGDYLAAGFPGQSRILPDLYYNRYRDFDPTTGRYLQTDPVGLVGGNNPYLYASGNPVNVIDPAGLAPRKLSPDSQECQDLLKKIENIRKDIAHRREEVRKNPLNLPLKAFPGSRPRDTVEGHENLIRDLEEQLTKREKEYDDKCGGGNCPPSGQATKNVAAAAGGAAALYLLYRAIRMLPSLTPPLWPTIPANAVIP